MTEKEIISEAPRELSESIKLTKNSKGYGWEIRMFPSDEEKVRERKYDDLVDRITIIDNKMRTRFKD